MVDKCQDWKGSLCFVLNGVMIEDLDKNIPFRVVKQNYFPVELSILWENFSSGKLKLPTYFSLL